MKNLGEVLGVDFWLDIYPVDGFRLELTNSESGETLFDNRMIGYTLWEAVEVACHQAWAEEMEQNDFDELPYKIATALGIEETYEEED